MSRTTVLHPPPPPQERIRLQTQKRGYRERWGSVPCAREGREQSTPFPVAHCKVGESLATRQGLGAPRTQWVELT